MTKCKYCNFDSECDSVYAEGAPCGYGGCHTYTCCHRAWQDHCRIAHPEYYQKMMAAHTIMCPNCTSKMDTEFAEFRNELRWGFKCSKCGCQGNLQFNKG